MRCAYSEVANVGSGPVIIREVCLITREYGTHKVAVVYKLTHVT